MARTKNTPHVPPHQGCPAVFPNKDYKSAEERKKLQQRKQFHWKEQPTEVAVAAPERANPVQSDLEDEPLQIWSGEPTPEWMSLSPTFPAEASPSIVELVDELNQAYLMLQPMAHPARELKAYPTPTSSPLRPIGAQLSTLLPETPGPSPNQSFEDGLTEDLPVEEGLLLDARPGPSSVPDMHNKVRRANMPLFRRPHPPTATVKAPRKQITRPAILRKWQQAWSALQDIKYLQLTHHTLLQTAPFARLVRDIPKDLGEFHITTDALMCFKEAAEAHLQDLIDKAKACMIHRKCITLSVTDLQLARYLSGTLDSLGPASMTKAHQDRINRECRAYTRFHMTYKQALAQDQSRWRKLCRLQALRREAWQDKVQAQCSR